MVNRVHEDDEVEAITGVPVLGVMPKRVGSGRPRLPALAPDEGAALLGVPQWIHARLRQSGSAPRAMVVLVTSATASEDTTRLSTCLAGRLAGDGARVLWIDADPHRSRRPRTFRTRPPDSASAAEAACRKDQAIRVDPGSGAHFLAAAPEKSRDMLDARQLTRLVERVRTHYDVVILDGSPILAGGNAVTVAGIADARLFVAECGRTRRDRLLTALSVLRNCGSMADGFVLTGVEPRRVYTILSVRPAEPSPVASAQIAHA
jgi:Mrp family chromosome partitioning ATPase